MAAEVGLSLLLLVGAGLMMRTLWALHKVDAGFDAKNVLTLQLAVEPAKYAAKSRESSTVIPGVTAVPAAS